MFPTMIGTVVIAGIVGYLAEKAISPTTEFFNPSSFAWVARFYFTLCV